MKVIHKIRDMVEFIKDVKRSGKTIGFVPTMGYFHEGHLSLMREAKKSCNIVVVSIFVNPIQFGKNEDYETYPKDLQRDLKMSEELDIDVIFNPEVKEMYPEGYCTYVDLDGNIVKTLCGRMRIAHFKGVATVVTKLFNIVKPDVAFFGQKDAQQCAVIKKMVKELNMDVNIVVLPTVREHDGLAMSSRNTYLVARERKIAPILYKTLQMAKHMIELGEKDANKVLREMRKKLKKENSVDIEYISIVTPETLEELETISGKVLIALAVKLGRTRLIDNVIVKHK